VEIPANTTATVHVPCASARSVTEGGRPASKSEGLRLLRMESGAAVFRADSGRYDFRAEGIPGSDQSRKKRRREL
jgi:alpha-L-rhamnosidase